MANDTALANSSKQKFLVCWNSQCNLEQGFYFSIFANKYCRTVVNLRKIQGGPNYFHISCLFESPKFMFSAVTRNLNGKKIV